MKIFNFIFSVVLALVLLMAQSAVSLPATTATPPTVTAKGTVTATPPVANTTSATSASSPR